MFYSTKSDTMKTKMVTFGDTPLLDKFFEGLGVNVRNYCAICLRTENERRLVNNTALRNLLMCTKLDNKWLHCFICYVCEKQAVDAMNFIRGVAFARNLDKLFPELMYQKTVLKRDVFSSSIFKSVLQKLNLVGAKYAPAEWEKHLREIRLATRDPGTDPGVGQVKLEPQSDSTDYVYEVPVVSTSNPQIQVNLTSPATNSSTLSDQVADQLNTHSDQLQRHEDQLNNHVDELNGHANQLQSQSGQLENRADPARPGNIRRGSGADQMKSQAVVDLTVPVTDDDVMFMIMPQSGSETLVILDDEEEEDLDIIIEKVVPEDVHPDPVLTNTGNTKKNTTTIDTNEREPKNNTVQRDPVTLIPIENIQKPKESTDTDSILLATTYGAFELSQLVTKNDLNSRVAPHSVFINNVTFQPNSKTSCIGPDPLHLDELFTFADRPNTSLNATKPQMQNNSSCYVNKKKQNSIDFAADVIVNNENQNVEESDSGSVLPAPNIKHNEITDRKRVADSVLPVATPSKVAKVLAVHAEVNSDKSRIDWEDKIPAGVIAFMDAVNPVQTTNGVISQQTPTPKILQKAKTVAVMTPVQVYQTNIADLTVKDYFKIQGLQGNHVVSSTPVVVSVPPWRTVPPWHSSPLGAPAHPLSAGSDGLTSTQDAVGTQPDQKTDIVRVTRVIHPKGPDQRDVQDTTKKYTKTKIS